MLYQTGSESASLDSPRRLPWNADEKAFETIDLQEGAGGFLGGSRCDPEGRLEGTVAKRWLEGYSGGRRRFDADGVLRVERHRFGQ